MRQRAEDLATAGTTARRLQLDAEEVYAYLWRVVLGPERMEEVIPGEPAFTRLPVIVAQRAAVVRRFAPGFTSPDVIRYVASVRIARLADGSEYDFDPGDAAGRTHFSC